MRLFLTRLLIASLIATALAPAGAAELSIPVATRTAFAAVFADARVQQGVAFIKADDENTLADQKAIVVIPNPSKAQLWYIGRALACQATQTACG